MFLVFADTTALFHLGIKSHYRQFRIKQNIYFKAATHEENTNHPQNILSRELQEQK